MEQLGGAARIRHHRNPPSSDRLLGIFYPPQSSSSSPTHPLELSEHDIFSTPSGGSSPSPTHPYLSPRHNPIPSLSPAGSFTRSSHSGILAALNDTRFGSEIRPVFNHKASSSASLSSSPITSPATSASSRIIIPRRPPPPVERVRMYHQSAPVNVPLMPAELQRSGKDWDDVVLEEEEENGVILPPHELVASRHSPALACSVMEGAGRTLKGRDLRQVRNAIWRKTGFLD